MARGKKAAQGLTPEEKLAQALVPMEEQPYQIPDNWCWIQLNCIKKDKDSFFDGDWILSSDMDSDGDVRLLQLSDIGIGDFLDKSDKHISFSTYKKLNCTKLCAGDVMISRMAEPIARSCIVPEFSYTAITAVDVAIMRCNSAIIINRFLNYLCNTPWFTDLAFSRARGTTRVRITRANLGEMPLPLPPLSEQQRIVDRIESIFAKLDEAKEKAQAVVDGFELRKSAILHKAFTGELTAKWREEHKIEIADWKNYKIDECCKVGSGGTPSRKHPEYYEGSIPWIKTGEIDWNDILDAEEKISDAAVQDSSAKIYEPGVVLVAMYGMGVTRGKAAILRVQAATNQAVCVLQPKNDLLNRYLFYYFMYNYWNIREKSVGGNQLNLSATIIKNFDILIPSIDEQSEIIRILDGLLAKEKAAKEVAESVLDQIETMKKAVLVRAFRGELGTNDPTEESAVELLKTML